MSRPREAFPADVLLLDLTGDVPAAAAAAAADDAAPEAVAAARWDRDLLELPPPLLPTLFIRPRLTRPAALLLLLPPFPLSPPTPPACPPPSGRLTDGPSRCFSTGPFRGDAREALHPLTPPTEVGGGRRFFRGEFGAGDAGVDKDDGIEDDGDEGKAESSEEPMGEPSAETGLVGRAERPPPPPTPRGPL